MQKEMSRNLIFYLSKIINYAFVIITQIKTAKCSVLVNKNNIDVVLNHQEIYLEINIPAIMIL